MTDSARESSLPSLGDADWLRRPSTQAVLGALAAAGFAARAVGGAVRNTLLGLPVSDIDMATSARPEQVIAACAAAGLATIPTGLQHGTVTVMAAGEAFEVTTLREDVATDGRHATVAFSDDWAADARRRDFTMNALYCDAEGTVLDPLGGLGDLRARHVRFIGDADARIREDYLRILRFFRFHATYGRGAPDAPGLAACIRGRAGLARLSAERIRAELMRLVVAPGAVDAIVAMGDCGLLPAVLGVAPRPGVLRAMVAAETAHALTPEAVLRLSSLAVAVAEDAPRLALRLKLSNAEAAALTGVTEAGAAALLALDAAAARRTLYRSGAETWRRQVRAALAAARFAGRGEAAEQHCLALLRLPERWPIPKLPVKGADVLALGIAPGPAVGALLAALEDWWVSSDFPPEAAVRDRLAALAGG